MVEYLEKCTDDLAISDAKMTVTKIKKDEEWDNGAFGKLWIDSTSNSISKWIFNINHLKDNERWTHAELSTVSIDEVGRNEATGPCYRFGADG